MKFKVLQEDFSKHLATALRFSSSKMQLPVLANILLVAKKGILLIKATNLETSIAIKVGAKIEEDGDVTVPAKVISELVSNLESGQIEVEVEKERIKLITPQSKSVVSGMNSADFPKINDQLSGEFVEISSQELSDAFKNTFFSVSNDETRPVLTGVLVVFEEGLVTLVGTDGFRLSEKSIKSSGIKKTAKIILPRNAVGEILRLVSDEKTLKLSLDEKENQVIVNFSNAVLASRIIEGEYPDFEKIIPKVSKTKVTIDKEDLLRSVKLASVFAKDSANMIKFKISKDRLDVLAESGKSGEGSFNIDAKIEGEVPESFTIAFNYRFLEDFIGVSKSEDIIIKFNDPNSPAVFSDTKDPDFLHLIMPIRLQE